MSEATTASLLRNLSVTDSLAAAYLICGDTQGAIEIIVQSVATIRKAHRANALFFNGKATRSIIGGLLYLVCFRCYRSINQKTIADVLNTSDTSIRRSYREWLRVFPDLFADVQEKIDGRCSSGN
ncbi:MAG: hypothetical protein NWE93_04555 [Candidatus Bathyarchaeota archaeon]|nr:hypothetical protein [Candidatus Bathyarchaeota archaeon]